MCGTAGPVQVDDTDTSKVLEVGTPPSNWTTTRGAPPNTISEEQLRQLADLAAAPKPTEADAFAAALGPLFQEALDYVSSRDRQRAERDAELDTAEGERRELVAKAKIDLMARAQTLTENLSELALAATAYVNRLSPLNQDRKPVVE